jgi:glycosyltransferase involved in cell wall biosynthesis
MNIVCVSHLRWDFVFQRPQHLLSRAARDGLVLYVEEPMFGEEPPHLTVTVDSRTNVMVGVPHLPLGLAAAEQHRVQRELLDAAIARHIGTEYVLWYYTPMATMFTQGLSPAAVVFDCMDELSAFAGAPADLRAREEELFRIADVVFTGGQSLYEAKRTRHPNVHAFPSSVDVEHFARARALQPEPRDQARLPRPRLGFYGVSDERMDYALLADVAASRPDWQLVLVGPVAKVDPAALPRAANIHYLGAKSYADLPAYLAGWDVALLPFARNEATHFISPTKTPEYLAAGKPVVSTSIRDVVRPYGQQGLARIADTPAAFVTAVEEALAEDAVSRIRAADAFLTHMSWDGTWRRMHAIIEESRAGREAPARAAAGKVS